MKLSEIHLYPIKSCAGLSVAETTLDRFGPGGDRRWMIVDEQGVFITQREYPRMCLIGARPLPGGGLELSAGGDRLTVGPPAGRATHCEVEVWEQRVSAWVGWQAADTLLSAFLGTACRLAYMPDDSRRPVDPKYARSGQTVGFADGFPLLLISQASLDELNRRLSKPVPMSRFRPNLVVEGCEPFAEDTWRAVRIGTTELQVAEACSRCVVPSIDQSSGERDSEILRVLASFRRVDGAVYFGQNLLYDKPGTLAVGQDVEIIPRY